MRAQDPPCPWNVYACKYAAKYGKLQVLEWMRKQNPCFEMDESFCSDEISELDDLITLFNEEEW